MTDNVIQLERGYPAQDIPQTLRRIADQVEIGNYGLMTSCAICLGHTVDRPGEPGEREESITYELFGAGPRVDAFTIRGLLLTCATRL